MSYVNVTVPKKNYLRERLFFDFSLGTRLYLLTAFRPGRLMTTMFIMTLLGSRKTLYGDCFNWLHSLLETGD